MVIESLGYFSDFFYYFSYFTSLFYYLPCFAGFSHELVEIPHCSTGFFHNLLCFTDIFHDPVELVCRSAGLFHELVELFKWLIHGHICTPPLSFLQFSLPDTCSVSMKSLWKATGMCRPSLRKCSSKRSPSWHKLIFQRESCMVCWRLEV